MVTYLLRLNRSKSFLWSVISFSIVISVFVQGYYFSKPLSVDAFTAFVHNHVQGD
jgi:hypothetical protein